MSAQPVEPGVHTMSSPDPVRQRLASYRIEDMLALPDDAPRLYACGLAPEGAHNLMADSDPELVLERPFPIRLSIGDITP